MAVVHYEVVASCVFCLLLANCCSTQSLDLSDVNLTVESELNTGGLSVDRVDILPRKHQNPDGAGKLVGWRTVSMLEYPYVVSIMHSKFRVHVCTGVLVTTRAVLTYIRCVVRRKKVGDKAVYKLAGHSTMIVTSGTHDVEPKAAHSFDRQVNRIVTPHFNIFNGELVLLLIDRIPRSIFHWPVKLYSTDLGVMGRKLQQYVDSITCEIVTWEDTIILSATEIVRPKCLKAYRVKLLNSNDCQKQEYRLGVRSIGEWSLQLNKTAHTQCVFGMGGRRCGSAPGGPIICGNAVYGLMSMGTSCSEFADYTFFVPLNTSELKLLSQQLPEPFIGGAMQFEGTNSILLRALALLALSTMAS